jgi:hypothetical protein
VNDADSTMSETVVTRSKIEGNEDQMIAMTSAKGGLKIDAMS